MNSYLLSRAISHFSPTQIGKDRNLGYDACTTAWFSKGEYLAVAGANRTCVLMTREGVTLGAIGEHSSWIWAAAVKPGSNYVVGI